MISVTRVRSTLPGIGAFGSETPLHATHVSAGGAWRGIDGTAFAPASPAANGAVARRPLDVPVAFQAGDKQAGDKSVMTIAKQGARRTKGSSPWRFPA